MIYSYYCFRLFYLDAQGFLVEYVRS